MNWKLVSTATVAPLLLAACASLPSAEQQAGYAAESRAAVGQFAKTLQGELKQALQSGGPENAIEVCKDRAPKITAAVAAEKGVSLRRVTNKSRNPGSVPDAWEAMVLQDFEQRLAQGAKPDSLERYEVVKDGNAQTFRYMKGLVVQEVCMLCHGSQETIPDGVKAKLAAEYPHDKATGYQPNMLRGAVSLKKPL
jgi:hypothetical protein